MRRHSSSTGYVLSSKSQYRSDHVHSVLPLMTVYETMYFQEIVNVWPGQWSAASKAEAKESIIYPER